MVMRMKAVRILREMARLLNADLRLRRLCLIKTGEKGYFLTALKRSITASSLISRPLALYLRAS
jgi:hypothetical protein